MVVGEVVELVVRLLLVVDLVVVGGVVVVGVVVGKVVVEVGRLVGVELGVELGVVVVDVDMSAVQVIDFDNELNHHYRLYFIENINRIYLYNIFYTLIYKILNVF